MWRRIPLARTVAAPGPGSVFILHFRSNNSLVHALLAVLLILSPSILKYPDHPVFEYLTALGMHASCVGQQPPAHLSGHGCQLLSHWNVNK